MKPPRLTWIDYARGIAIILVVYRHNFEGLKESGVPVDHYMFLEYLNIFFFSFRMPLFFIISGIFVAGSLQKRGLPNFVETKMRSILYPYFLWGFLQLSLQMVFSKYTNGHPTPESYLHLFYLPREIAQFWYLYALFNVSVLYAFAKQVLKLSVRYQLMIGLAAFYISSLLYQKSINVGFVSDILHNYIFYAIGDAISRVITDRKNFKWFESGKLLSAMLLPFILAQAYFLWANLDHANAKYMFVEYYQPFAFLLIAIVGCAFIINLTFVMQRVKILNWLPELGRHSLYIYVSHVIIFACVRIILTKFLGVTNVPLILISGITAGLIGPIILYKLAVKFNMRWIFTLEKEDKKESTHTFIKPVASSASLENNR
ncbi:MAG: hypothetical protein JWQ27_2842 [Ferruginibacter sp.]|nr:hypothetical protein [Ferruginibacter sp.]